MVPDSEPPPSDAIDLTRQALYDQVWTTPLSRLARTFRRSPDWLARTCSDAGIPVPGRGWWTKKRAGQRAPRRALRKGTDPDEIVITYYPSHEPPEPREPPPPLPRPRLDGDLEKLRAAIEAAGPMPAAADLEQVHPVVARTRTSLLGSIAKGWDRHGLFQPRDDGCLSLEVSQTSLDRALRFFEGLLRAAIRFGTKVIQQDEKVGLRICGELAAFHLRERPRMHRLTPKEVKAMGPLYSSSKVRWEGSGIFALTLLTGVDRDRDGEWQDDRRGSIESRIPEILHDTVEKLQSARTWRRGAPERARIEAQRLEEQRRLEMVRIQQRLQEEEEQRRVARLLEVAVKHERFTMLRAFLGECRTCALTDPLDQQWLAWAEGVLRRLDPLMDGLAAVRRAVGHRGGDGSYSAATSDP